MKLTELRLHNFRQFYGTTPPVVFSSGLKKVTVIHGANGSGKTALLNALTWALYGSFTRGFQLPDQLINKRALREASAGDSIQAWVELSWEHLGKQYSLRRTAEAIKTEREEWSSRTQSPILQVANADGEWKRVQDVEGEIGKVLPNDLHNYFFFDGERIENIVQPDREEGRRLAKATKKLLGVTPLERGIRDLDRVRKSLESGLMEIGDQEIKQLLEEKNGRERREKQLEEEIENLDKECRAHEKIKEEIQEQLRKLEKVSDLQRRRDELHQRRQKLSDQRVDTLKRLNNAVGKNAFSALIEEQIKEFENSIEALRRQGELPTGIKTQFVQSLLESEKCICNRDLIDGPERNAVEAWMERAGLMDVEEQAIRMGGEVSALRAAIPTFWERVDEIQKGRDECRAELGQCRR